MIIREREAGGSEGGRDRGKSAEGANCMYHPHQQDTGRSHLSHLTLRKGFGPLKELRGFGHQRSGKTA